MVDFKEFVKALSTFNPQHNNEEEKLKFLFKVYDLDQDGLLSQDEIRIILK
jgi:serine/threonine-protein phosphatase 2B regulatory subunit